ncbi:MAG: glutamine-hydrolyzing GMP synthase [Spirochaetota bacterium]
MDAIVVLDFGGQTAQLIGRRIRDLGVYSEILPGTVTASDITSLPGLSVRGIVLSGSPASVHDEDAPRPDPAVFELGLPVLGICYGLQTLIHRAGGAVARATAREYGRAKLRYASEHPLFASVPEGFTSWMSHGDHVLELPAGAVVIAESEHGVPAAIALPGGEIGIQFHPEVTHCEYGSRILENFALGIAGAAREWSLENYVEESSRRIRETVGPDPVLLLISGGVDSTVVGALLLHALDPKQVHLMYVDTGLMRKGESDQVAASLRRLGATHLDLIDAGAEFLAALRDVDEPEKKREIIGDLFITVQQREIESRIPGEYYLAQGTLYTDMIESGGGVGKYAHVIKSHHNVRSPLVAAKREAGRVVEPLSKLYKDEVRKLGALLGVAPEIIGRHPFPGPGLAVRILGAVTPEKCRILREADAIYMDELRARGLYDEIWQAFTVLLPIRSVGVTGDTRHYGYVLALRAVTSSDGMTADVYPFGADDLLAISARITNRVPEIGRVVYDVSSKPPATIEWE